MFAKLATVLLNFLPLVIIVEGTKIPGTFFRKDCFERTYLQY